MENALVSRFDERGTIRIILALENGQKNFTELFSILRKSGVGQTALYSALEVLKEAKLIKEIEPKHRARIFELTDNGQTALELLRQVTDLLG